MNIVEIVDLSMHKLILQVLKVSKSVDVLVPLLRTLIVLVPILMKKQKIGSDPKTFSAKLFNISKIVLIDWPIIVDSK